VGIERRRGYVTAIVNRINRCKGIFLGKRMIEPDRAKILANRLGRAAETCEMPLKSPGLQRERRPQIQQWLDARDGNRL
jgi:hypothetical protein